MVVNGDLVDEGLGYSLNLIDLNDTALGLEVRP